MSEQPAEIGRRDFIGRAAGRAACALGTASLVGMLAGCASLVTRRIAPVNGALRLALAHYPELNEAGGSLKVVPEGSEDAIYILVTGERQYAALSPICTHLGCTVDIQEARLVCPCHGSTYDRDGKVLRGPAARPLARFRTELTPDGVLVIDLAQRT